MLDNLPQVNHFLDVLFSYGSLWIYLVIFAACFIENVFPPFPGDTFIVAAGGLVGLARLPLIPSLAVVIVGGTASVMLLYLLGDRYGRAYFIKKIFKYFNADDIHEMEAHFRRYGGALMLVSRFVLGFRSAIALVAGISEYSPIKTVVYTVLSYLLFAGAIFYVSITLVDNLDRIETYFRTYSTVVWPLLFLLAAVYIGRMIYRHVRKG
jgi:membrane protein DedA with SNARE-associated domain